MDAQVSELNHQGYQILHSIGYPLRIPTITWLFSDIFGVIDIVARNMISDLIDEGKLKNTGMGWIEVH